MTDYTKLPNDPILRESLRMYVEEGYQPGHFLLAVLSNDLFDAFGRADYKSEANLPAIVRWIYNDAPSNCWGSREKVRAWIETFWPRTPKPGNRLDDGSNEAIADREDFDDHELTV